MKKTPFKITFIGTGGIMPHKKRLFPFMMVELDQKLLFMDMGEGSQRALLRLSTKLIIPDYIFISHYHLDHFYGLYPFLKTLEMVGVKKKIKIFLPEDVQRERYLRDLLILNLNLEIITGNLPYVEDRISFNFFETKHTYDSRGIFVKISERRNYTREILLKLRGPLLSKLKKNKELLFEDKKYRYQEVTEVTEEELSLVYTSDTSQMKLPTSDYLIHQCTYLEGEQNTAKDKKHTCLTTLKDSLVGINYRKIFLVHLHPKRNIYPELPIGWSWPTPYEVIDLNEDS